MSDDFIPANDDEFNKAQTKLVDAVTADPARFGVTAQDVTALQAAQAAWTAAYPAHIKAQQQAQTATRAKEIARENLEAIVRSTARKINGTHGMDNATRAEAGLPQRSGGRAVIGAPATRPLGRIEIKPNRTMVIHFVDESTPQRLAKPQGVHGCQIWQFIGDAPPADASGWAFIALDTRTPYADEHEAEDAGKLAHYRLRWQNTKGEPGPWSDVITARIPA
ncbi:Hypothetical protein A7982_02052 [Minicystis rosea]|nr:Hypothetical protein A7982_02052 [Minicystis rosea]